MSVKTEAIKPIAEISLFDAFGPNVSEQVQAINHRAAELSMDDMALVMGVKGSAKTKSALLAGSDNSDGVDSYDSLAAWFDSKGNRVGATFQLSPTLIAGCMRSAPDFSNSVPVAGAVVRAYVPTLRTSLQGFKDVMTAVSTKLHHLQGVGVDESKVTVSIRYKDPKTGAFRSEPVDAESVISPAAFATPKQRVKKSRRIGREVVMHMVTAKK